MFGHSSSTDDTNDIGALARRGRPRQRVQQNSQQGLIEKADIRRQINSQSTVKQENGAEHHCDPRSIKQQVHLESVG